VFSGGDSVLEEVMRSPRACKGMGREGVGVERWGNGLSEEKAGGGGGKGMARRVPGSGAI